MPSKNRIAVAVVVQCIAWVGVSSAVAAVGDSTVDACLNAGTASPPCSSAAGITHDFPLVLSPDGHELYVATAGGTAPGGLAEDPTILIFDRDPATGAITRRAVNGCVTRTGSSGACVAAPLLTDPQDMVVSADGRSLYVSDSGSSAILEFSRASDGALTLLGTCQASAGTCGAGGSATVNGMGVPQALAVRTDASGDNVYLRSDVSEGQGTLLVFDRQSDGTLRQKATTAGCLAEASLAGCTDVAGISRQGWQLAVSPDGTNVYATGRDDAFVYNPCGNCPVDLPPSGTITTFARTAGGALSFTACISSDGLDGGGQTTLEFPNTSSCTDGNDALLQARSVTLSPDGKTAYVGADPRIVTYARDPTTGALTDQGTVAIPSVFRMAAVPDGTDLIAESTTSNGFFFLARDTTNGAIAQRPGKAGCLTQTGNSNACNTLAALGGLGSVTVGADSMSVYLTGSAPGVVARLHRDFAPVCDPKSVDVLLNTSLGIPLSCTDPNGDAVALGIGAAPTAGILAAVDQTARTVRYNPFSGFLGADSFTYTGTANGVTSAPATVALNVVAQGAGPTPSAVPHLSSTVSRAFKVFKRFTEITTLRVNAVPAGVALKLTCNGKGCPLKSKKLSFKKATASVNLARFFNFTRKRTAARKARKVVSKLRVGTRIEIDMTAPNMIGRFVALRIRAAKAPSATTGCLSDAGVRQTC